MGCDLLYFTWQGINNMIYNYIVWVGGVDDYYINYEDAKRDYNYWINQGYNDVILEEIKWK